MAQKEVFLQMDILAASVLRAVGNNTWVEMHLHVLGPLNSNHMYFTLMPNILQNITVIVLFTSNCISMENAF